MWSATGCCPPMKGSNTSQIVPIAIVAAARQAQRRIPESRKGHAPRKIRTELSTKRLSRLRKHDFEHHPGHEQRQRQIQGLPADIQRDRLTVSQVVR